MSKRRNWIGLTLLASLGTLLVTTAHAPPSGSGTVVQVASSGGGSSAGLGVAVTATGSLTTVVSPRPPHAEPETRLIRVLETFRNGDIDVAIKDVEQLVADKPNFRLAHLIYGDLLASRAGVPMSFQSQTMASADVSPLMDEARQRWKHYKADKLQDMVPEPIVQLSNSQRHALIVDLDQSRLFVFENRDGEPVLLGDYYVSGGKNGAHKQVQGDRKTPVGVYFVVNRLPGADLPDKYGPVAFPVDYPNEWDHRHGRTGGGIWLHGVASTTYSRPPLDSDGCVALSNQELSQIAPLLEARSTPVLIGEHINWIARADIKQRRTVINAAIDEWRTDWESGEVSRYLSHYSEEFRGRGMDKTSWDAYKTRVTQSKRFIRVALQDVSVLAHPFERDMMVVSFRQQYDSDRFNSESTKRQYWRIEADGQWRIISEESV